MNEPTAIDIIFNLVKVLKSIDGRVPLRRLDRHVVADAEAYLQRHRDELSF